MISNPCCTRRTGTVVSLKLTRFFSAFRLKITPADTRKRDGITRGRFGREPSDHSNERYAMIIIITDLGAEPLNRRRSRPLGERSVTTRYDDVSSFAHTRPTAVRLPTVSGRSRAKKKNAKTHTAAVVTLFSIAVCDANRSRHAICEMRFAERTSEIPPGALADSDGDA